MSLLPFVHSTPSYALEVSENRVRESYLISDVYMPYQLKKWSTLSTITKRASSLSDTMEVNVKSVPYKINL